VTIVVNVFTKAPGADHVAKCFGPNAGKAAAGSGQEPAGSSGAAGTER